MVKKRQKRHSKRKTKNFKRYQKIFKKQTQKLKYKINKFRSTKKNDLMKVLKFLKLQKGG